jgi:hypothetical protein
MVRRGWVLVLGLSWVACSSSSNDANTPSTDAGGSTSPDASAGDDATTAGTDGGHAATQTVGAAGGTVTAGGVTLTIPSGALGGDTAITVTTTSMHAPTDYTALSPVFAFAPAGMTFLQPVTVSIAVAAPSPGATVFWSNANGGYDARPTTITADSVSAPISFLADGFAGVLESGSDAGTPSEAGPASEAGPTGDDGGSGDAAPPTGPLDSGPQADAGPTDAAVTLADSGAASDGSTPGIFATVDGTSTAFVYNIKASPLQGYWQLSADDSPSPTHWTILVLVSEQPLAATCGASFFPRVTYTHSTAVSADAGAVDATYLTSQALAGSACSVDETATATVQGESTQGTFTATVVASTAPDGGPASHTVTAGSYDVVVP